MPETSETVRRVVSESKATIRERKANGEGPSPTQLERSLKAAKRYRARGWEPVPCCTDQKETTGTRIKEWTTKTPKQLADEFDKSHSNVGLRWNKSTKHCAVDLDCPETVALWHVFLPPTLGFGRESKRLSHLIYKCEANIKRFGVLDFLGHGSFSLAPPSIHKSGERLEWVDFKDKPAELKPDDLLYRVSLLAACSKILQHWQKPHRDELAFITCCLLQDADVPQEQAQQVIDEFVSHGGCDKADEKTLEAKAEHVYTLKDNAKRKGIPKLREIIGDDANKVREWLLVDSFDEPVDLWDIGDAVAFPLDLLPPILRDFALDVAERVSVPVEATIFPGLVAGCWAWGSKVRVQLQPGFTQPAILYAFIAMRSGSGKSPASAPMFEPVDDEQRRMFEKYEDELDDWSKAGKGRGPEPKLGHVHSKNMTVEGIQAQMELVPEGTLINADELSGVLTWNQYKGGSGSDQQQFLEMYDGNSITVTRKSAGSSLYIPRAQLNIYGGIQPSVLPELYNPENMHAGLVARFGLCAYPTRMLRKVSGKEPDEAAKLAYTQQLLRLRRAMNDEMVLEFDSTDGIKEWIDALYLETHKAHEPFSTHLAKFSGMLGRLSLALYAFEVQFDIPYSGNDFDGEFQEDVVIKEAKIPTHILQNAMHIIDHYLKPHARRLYRSVATAPGEPLGKHIARMILETKPMHLTARDVSRTERTAIRCASKQQIENAFEFLESRGWGRVNHEYRKGVRGPCTTRFTVNPAVFAADFQTE